MHRHAPAAAVHYATTIQGAAKPPPNHALAFQSCRQSLLLTVLVQPAVLCTAALVSGRLRLTLLHAVYVPKSPNYVYALSPARWLVLYESTGRERAVTAAEQLR